MKKILIIGASNLQLPAIIKAKELGYFVGVVDYNPKAVGILYSDAFFEVSTIDIDGVTNVAKTFLPDGIMTIATDMPMRSIAKATEAIGLPGISLETAVKATDKGEMIKAFEANNVEHPWFYIIVDESDLAKFRDNISFPCIMKPTDNAGSRGVVLVHDYNELLNEYEYSKKESRSGTVIIEEYLEGSEVSVEVMVIDGDPFILQVTDKLTTGFPHFVEIGHTQPSALRAEDIDDIKDLACRAIKAVGIETGPAHVEIMLTDKGPKMIELGARMGGDCITSHLVPLSTGIDMIKATIELACGKMPDIEVKYHKGAAIRFIQTDEGIIEEIGNIEEVKQKEGVKEVTLLKKAGDKAGKIQSSIDRIGYVITQADNACDAARLCEDAVNDISIVISNSNE